MTAGVFVVQHLVQSWAGGVSITLAQEVGSEPAHVCAGQHQFAVFAVEPGAGRTRSTAIGSQTGCAATASRNTVTDRCRQRAHPRGGWDGDRFAGLSGRVGEISERPLILCSECCRTARCGSSGKAS